MEWALTAVVLGSVSVLVVTLTLEPHGQALGHRNGFTLSRGRFVLHRVLLAARVLGIAAGRQARSAGKAAGHRLFALSVSVAHGARDTLRAGLRLRLPTRALPVRRRRRKARAVRFQDCLQTTGPEITVWHPARSTLSLASTPASTSWLSRGVALFELVAVILVAGGAIAFAVFAVGWRAARLF